MIYFHLALVRRNECEEAHKNCWANPRSCISQITIQEATQGTNEVQWYDAAAERAGKNYINMLK
jgi:hypothetical protein